MKLLIYFFRNEVFSPITNGHSVTSGRSGKEEEEEESYSLIDFGDNYCEKTPAHPDMGKPVAKPVTEAAKQPLAFTNTAQLPPQHFNQLQKTKVHTLKHSKFTKTTAP